MQRLRAEIKDLAETRYNSLGTFTTSSDSAEQESRKPNLRSVKSGEDSIPRIPIPSSIAPHPSCVQSKQNPPVSVDKITRSPFLNGAVDTSTMSTDGGGLAERLVMYSENLVRPHGLCNSADDSPVSSGCSSSGTNDDKPLCSEIAVGVPLTLSQLSPSKSTEPSPIPESKSRSNVPVSSIRQSYKRHGSPLPNAQPVKKEKTFASFRTIPPGNRSIVRKRIRSRNSSSSFGKAVAHTSRTLRDPLVSSKGSSGTSSAACSMEQGRPSGSSSRSLTNPGGSSKSARERFAGSTHMLRKHPTRPVGFDFRSDMRIEVHKTSVSVREHDEEPPRKRKLHTSYTVPDFKSSHAAQDALLTSLKGRIKPVAPLPVEMHTDVRARERSKFNEHIREKEIQASQALEERKRQQAEEEEKELKEQRKKAIPKAHPVPDWYKDAPRRKEPRPPRSEGTILYSEEQDAFHLRNRFEVYISFYMGRPNIIPTRFFSEAKEGCMNRQYPITTADLLSAATVAGAGIMLPTAPSGREWNYQDSLWFFFSFCCYFEILHSVYYA
ncbi:protein [Lentinula edodes]|uniref:Protein n=1 Tax=Lentinula edodes TaxID=5353 RepID=A0A1Q3ERR0_LENED|nr:protein [Lentinula edodes]